MIDPKEKEPKGPELELLRSNKELTALNTISEDFIRSKDLDEVLDTVLDHILKIIGIDIGWISIFDDASGRFILKKYKGIGMGALRSQVEGYKVILDSEKPFFLVDLSENQEPYFDALRAEGIKLYIGVPLRHEDHILGILNLASRGEKKIEFKDIKLLTLMADRLTLVIDKIRLYEESSRLAITDGLTGIYNSRYFYRILDREIARTDRYSTPFSLIIFDVDNFKKCNDTYGHQAGDDVLQGVVSIMSSMARKVDIVARYGGEEFVILLPNTDRKEAHVLAERIRKDIEDHIFRSPFIREGYKVTISGGIATYPEDGRDSKSIMYAVDQALYRAKEMGKNRVWSYEK